MSTVSNFSTFQDLPTIDFPTIQNVAKKKLLAEKIIWIITKIFISLALAALTLAGTLQLGFSFTACLFASASVGLIAITLFAFSALFSDLKKVKEEKQRFKFKIKQYKLALMDWESKFNSQAQQLASSRANELDLEAKLINERSKLMHDVWENIVNELREIEDLAENSSPLLNASPISHLSPSNTLAALSSFREPNSEEETLSDEALSEEEYHRMAVELETSA